ncbi:O-phospho-L-seryl-tRNA:Cys-tRNA synthase [Candidatus Parcubacteria bacterium]|nr:O-phospho-L-seryl-tRNA:Cys-tRNA synthase [Candidatus Parcubacteria bacterium]
MTNENLKKFEKLERKNKGLINLNPIQKGGELTKVAEKALVEFGDGYSIYDLSPGLELMEMPLIKEFIQETMPKFLGADIVRITLGVREGIFNVIHSIAKPGKTILVDGNRHYTTIIAAERTGLKVVEVPNSGEPEYKINVEDYEDLIKKHKPALVLLTYPDGNYGNLPDAKRLGEIVKRYQVPYLINGAYAVGRMPISMKELGADFIIGSGQKSMASSGPIGVLGMDKKWEKIILRKSKIYPQQEIEFLGSELRGTAMATLMASFPAVLERVKNWEKEKKKAQWFSKEMEKLGLKQIGDKPHKHDLIFFKAEPFYKISLKHPKGRFFLHYELKKRGITGIKPGLTKHFKLSTFSIDKEDLEKVIKAFREILKK